MSQKDRDIQKTVLSVLLIITLAISVTYATNPSNNCESSVEPISFNDREDGTTDPSGQPYDNSFDCGRGGRGPDGVYKLAIATPGGPDTFKVRLLGEADFDADWGIAASCRQDPQETESDIACWDFIYPGNVPTPTPNPSGISYDNLWGWLYVDLILENNTTYYIWVDGHTHSDKGNFRLTVSYATVTPTPTPAATKTPTMTPTACVTSTPTSSP